MKQFRRIRSEKDRTVQFSALVPYSLTRNEEEAEGLAKKDQAEKKK